MKKKKNIIGGVLLLCLFLLWTVMIKTVDVKSVGVGGSDIGFATINTAIHECLGVNMQLYNITDWLGLVPIFVCMAFGLLGAFQLVKRKSLFKVDLDIIASGIYYVVVIALYLAFEMIPINYRPIMINGVMEASYPSSTTLLVLCVMPSLSLLVSNRADNIRVEKLVCGLSSAFSLFMVVGRLLSGVHWFTDIAGAILLSKGLFCILEAVALNNNRRS